MVGTDGFGLLFFSLSAQFAGLVSLAFIRVGEGSEWARLSHRVFFIALCLVGATTIMDAAASNGVWITGGSTLALMLVGSIFDAGGRVQTSF